MIQSLEKIKSFLLELKATLKTLPVNNAIMQR